MCGIVGVMGHNLGYGELQKFKDLMVLAQLRGDEGAGMIAVPKKSVIHSNAIRVKRTTWSSGHLVTTSDYDECVKGDTNILIGHARQPTKGSTKIENVHPHRFEDVILVHNGTMTYVGDESVPKDASDSKMVCRTIAKKGPQGFADSSWGAYCLVWIDLRNQTLNFLRNNERPLAICEERNSIMESSPVRNFWWASEAGFLHMALGRYSNFVKEKHKFYFLPKNEHWSFPLDVKTNLADATITKCERTPFASSTPYASDWEGWLGENQTPLERNRSVATQNSGSVPSVAITRPGNAGFSYVPPEHRQRNTGTDRAVGTPVTSINCALVFSNSKRDAELATAKAERERLAKEAAVNSGTFLGRETSDLDYYACKDKKKIVDLVSGAPCVWCSQKPLFVEGKSPKIFPVRFTDTRGEYVCEGCIQDLDVQRMVGMAC